MLLVERPEAVVGRLSGLGGRSSTSGECDDDVCLVECGVSSTSTSRREEELILVESKPSQGEFDNEIRVGE